MFTLHHANQTDKNSPPAIYLYIPYSKENNLDLLRMARKWQENVNKSVKAYKNPQIIVHHDSTLHTNEISDSDIRHRFNIDEIPPGSVIYILGHGIGSKTAISNSLHKDIKNILQISDVANRLKKAGFSPEVANQFKSICLYICEINNNANEFLAKEFAINLGKDYHFLHVSYYQKKVGLPQSPTSPTKPATKLAIKYMLPNLNGNQMAEVMPAHECKKTFQIADALREAESVHKLSCFSFCTYWFNAYANPHDHSMDNQVVQQEYMKLL